MRALLVLVAGAVAIGVVVFAPPRHERSIYYRTRGRRE